MAEHVIVVGAGIVGASIARHLACAGARVTVLDAATRGGVATRASWAWINASWGNPEPYFRLRFRAMEEWRRLASDLPDLAPAWTGGLIWDLPAEKLEAFAAEHSAWGYGIRRVTRAEAARIEPALAEPPDLALHVAAEGAVDAVAATRTLLADAGTHGAEVRENTPVRALTVAAGRVAGVETDAGTLTADAVVVAAGEAAPALMATAGVDLPLDAPPGLLVRTRPAPPLLNGLVMAPDLHVRQDGDGRLIAGADFGGTDPGDDPQAAADQVFHTLRAMLTGTDGLAPDGHTIGRRPTPADGFPVVGPVAAVPGLHVAVTHSGVTLAPALGRFLADHILHGRREPLLAPCGIDRFARRT